MRIIATLFDSISESMMRSAKVAHPRDLSLASAHVGDGLLFVWSAFVGIGIWGFVNLMALGGHVIGMYPHWGLYFLNAVTIVVGALGYLWLKRHRFACGCGQTQKGEEGDRRS